MSSQATDRRIELLGCRIDALDMNQTVARCTEVIERGGYMQQVSINTAKLITLHDDPRQREIVETCGLVNADGQGVVWASRLLGSPLPGRVAGIDLMHRLFALAERVGYSVFILGARDEVLTRALARLRVDYPRLRIAGTRNGYFPDEEAAEVCADVRATGADIVFVAISSPRKEYLLGEHGPSLGAPLVMGVGGAIDVVAGVTRRAPRLWQRLGLEWLYRVLQEPRRLWRRYAVTNGRFALLVGRELVGRAAGRLLRRTPA